MKMKLGMHAYYIISKAFLIYIGGLPSFTEIYVVVYENERRLVNLNPVNIKREAYRDGIKRKGDTIGMGYMKHG